MSKPRVVVLGGCGFVGRTLVEYLVDKDLCSKIRVADKVLPALASLSENQKKAFEKVEFKQANLSRPATVAKVFDDEPYDYVFNLAGETKYGQVEAVYKENIIDVSVTTATEAAKKGAKLFIECSTAQVYDSSSKSKKEEAKLKPWTGIAKAKLQAEEEIKKIPNLNWIIVRPSVIYGPGDLTGITPRLITAAVYKSLNEKMEFLWDKDLACNTVHVRDVVSALWHLASTNQKPGNVYNLSDSNSTTQGTLCPILEGMFGIKTGFLGNMKSKVATSVAMKVVAETANDKHLKPWSDLCKENKITITPLTPYLDEELLYDNDLAIDGNAIESTGFKYQHPKVTSELVREALDYHIKNGYFPAGLLA